MEKRAREVMTPDPACCTPTTTLDLVAKMMIQTDCGEIPVLDVNDRVIGVVTDRDIVCRVVAEGKNPMAYTAETCMTQQVVTVSETPVLCTRSANTRECPAVIAKIVPYRITTTSA